MAERIDLRRDGWTVCFTPLRSADGREFVPWRIGDERGDLKGFLDGFPNYWRFSMDAGGYIGGPFKGGEYCFRSNPAIYP